MMACGIHRLLCVLVSAHLALSDNVLNIDPTGQLGRIFEGIGGISGGGATSKLLVNYPPDLQSQILDYLFKPNFGASLHILKVEIGGDIQSTDGSEPSHMHYSWDENYQRGYEWWLMTEAKKRNPDIKLYALPWGFPGWIGEGSQNPYVNPNKTSDYIVRWINAAKVYYNLTIDYVGIWNERGYSKDYIKTLRKTLDTWGFNKCLIIASDNGWDIVHDMKSDKELDAAVHAVGCHYPGTWASQEAYDSGRLLWASEDYSTYNDAVGAGCWSRILNQNYVNGLMTSTIAWDLIASYYEGLPYFRDGLMSAYQPWSGKYTVELPIWATAHTTQFVNIGWKYLGHKNGVGHLPRGGSYVSLMSPDQNDLTIIFETISHDHSYCIRPGLPWYSVDPQDVTITLKGQFANITQMNVWFSRYDFSKQNHSMFNKLEPLKFVNGSAKLHLDPDVMFTLTTMNTGVKGAYPDSPPAKPFPVPYSDDFESYSLYQEPYDLAPQSGSFEVLSEGNNKFIRQMVTQYPVLWCNVDQIKRPNALIGNVSWTDYLVEVDYRIPAVNGTTGAMVAARIDTGGCDMGDGHGLFFIVRQDGSFIVSTDIKTHNVIYRGNVTVQPGWHKLSIFVQGHTVLGAFDQKGLFNTTYSGNPNHGFAGIGTDSYGLADFDNFYIGTKEEGIAKMREYFKIHKPRPLLFVKTFQMN